MANVAAILSVSQSLATSLDEAYRAAVFPAGVAKPGCGFSVVSSGRIHEETDPAASQVKVVLVLHRVTVNPHLRQVGRPSEPDRVPPPLPLDLHFLVSFWSDSAQSEHLVAAWTLRHLHRHTVLDASTLSPEAGWAVEDVIQLIPEELSTEDMMRLWDTFTPKYRLSMAYVARVIRLDPEDQAPQHPPVVAARFDFATPTAAP